MNSETKYHEKVVFEIVEKKTKNLKNMRFSHKGSLVNMGVTHLMSAINHEVFCLMFKINEKSSRESYAVLAHAISPFNTDKETISLNVSRDVVFSNKFPIQRWIDIAQELQKMELENNTEEYRNLCLNLFLENSDEFTKEAERFNVSAYSEKLKKEGSFKLFEEVNSGYKKDFLKDLDLNSGVWNKCSELRKENEDRYADIRESSDLKELTDKEKDIEEELEKLKERIAFLEKEDLKVKRQIRDKVMLNMGEVSRSRNAIRRSILQEHHDAKEIKNRIYVLNRDGNLDINSESWVNALAMYKKTSENVLKLNEELKNN